MGVGGRGNDLPPLPQESAYLQDSKTQYIDFAEAKGEAPLSEKHCNKEIQLKLSLRSKKHFKNTLAQWVDTWARDTVMW